MSNEHQAGINDLLDLINDPSIGDDEVKEKLKRFFRWPEALFEEETAPNYTGEEWEAGERLMERAETVRPHMMESLAEEIGAETMRRFKIDDE